MTRLQRTLLGAAVVGGLGIAGTVAIVLRTPPQHERLRQRVESERLFAFGRLAVAAFTVERDGQSTRLVRDPAVQWRLEAPVRWPADLQAVEALLDRTAGLRAKRVAFADPTPQQLEDTGLDAPRLRLELELADGREHRLELGTTNPMTELLHARADGGDVVLVDPEFRWTLDRPRDELRMDRLFPYRTSDVTRIVVRPPEGDAWRLERQHSQGHRVVASGETFDAGEGVAAVFLSGVTKRLEAEVYRGDDLPFPAAPEAVGAVAVGSALSLTVHHVSGAVRSATIALAKDDFTGEVKRVAWVGSTLAELYAPPVDEIAATRPESLRDRSLAGFVPSAARRVRVEYADGGPPWVLERADADAPWRRTVPADAPVRASVMKEVLTSLAYLKGARTITETPTRAQLRDWGLIPASRRFVVEGDDEAPLADVRLGVWETRGETLYAKGQGPRVDVVELDRVLRIPGDRARLLGD